MSVFNVFKIMKIVQSITYDTSEFSKQFWSEWNKDDVRNKDDSIHSHVNRQCLKKNKQKKVETKIVLIESFKPSRPVHFGKFY